MPRTLEELNQKLADELIWRRKELTQIKGLIDFSSTIDRKDYLLRSALAILYAHWEGFILAASNLYLGYVSKRKLKYNEVSNNFLAYSLERRLVDQLGKTDVEMYLDTISLLLGPKEDRINIKADMDAGGNLNYARLKRIILFLGLNITSYETKRNLIDEQLLKNRNEIAHGDYLIVTKEGYEEVHAEILALMEDFRNQIDNAAVGSKYRV